jgi:hypothetical protein
MHPARNPWLLRLAISMASFGAVMGFGAEPALERRIGDAWSDSSNPIVRIFGGTRLDLWSLRPVSTNPPPGHPVAGERNPIDRFIRERLAGSGLEPSPEAGRRPLLRRLSLDLTGLPPTPAEMEAFLADTSEDAYQRQVERLLASPRHGEHQARLWLDVVRYSDSNGFDWDEFRPRAWRFRDYVVRSFNRDLPFGRFIREQLAGDELVEGLPSNADEQDAWIATGYLRMGPHDNAASLFNEQDRSRAELMADLVETTGSAFLGLTFSCCRCHDHKFDPLSQADHYRMRAFFEGVRFADDRPLDLEPAHRRIEQEQQEIDRRIDDLERQRNGVMEPVRQRLVAARLRKLPAEEQAEWQRWKTDPKSVPEERAEALRKRIEPGDKALKSGLEPWAVALVDSIDARIRSLRTVRPVPESGLLMTDAPEQPRVTRILFQGSHRSEREPVAPGFISALDPNPAPAGRPRNPKTLGRRLALAEWIASPTNPLTARVFVNRIWQQHFGTGLVASANDFGLAGTRPSHPELLDWLASEFVRSGGSAKALHRLIVSSATYRQSSHVRPEQARIDPGNRLLSRWNPRRLSAEQLRDSILAVSGQLRTTPGGPPVWPELPAEILQANPAFLDDNETRTKGWYPSPKSEQGVRSLFLVQKRTVRVPFLETFDLPENSTSCAHRDESTVAPQALTLLNSPFIQEASKALAASVAETVPGTEEARVRELFRRTLLRQPDNTELMAALRLAKDRSEAELARALLNLNEFVYID